eukprot:766034-Hanusia_phi.AAC.3
MVPGFKPRPAVSDITRMARHVPVTAGLHSTWQAQLAFRVPLIKGKFIIKGEVTDGFRNQRVTQSGAAR